MKNEKLYLGSRPRFRRKSKKSAHFNISFLSLSVERDFLVRGIEKVCLSQRCAGETHGG